jgi:formylglycine-generating enzyme required for sulfatase activity
MIRLQDIDEAIDHLHYRSETTLKAKLVKAVRAYYTDDTSSESLQAIDTEELVKTIWETGDDRDLVKTKRKNFSSVKSSVNSDFKKLYAEGKNPQGIIIGPANTFAISDEAKDKALAGIMDVFQDMGIDTQNKISKILTALSDVLINATSDAAIESTKEEIDRLKTAMKGLSEKLGLSLEDLVGQVHPFRPEDQATEPTAATKPFSEERRDKVLHIQDDLSVLDRGLSKLARDAVDAAMATHSEVQDALRHALEDILTVIKEPETTSTVKAKKIISAVEQMMDQTIKAAGDTFGGDQAQEIKDILQQMTKSVSAADETPQEASTADKVWTGDQVVSGLADILKDPQGNVQEKIGRILAYINEIVQQTLDASGLPAEEIAGMKEMMGHLAANVEAFVQGALAAEDILEEVIEEEALSDDRREALPDEAPPTEETAQDLAAETSPTISEDEIVEILEDEPPITVDDTLGGQDGHPIPDEPAEGTEIETTSSQEDEPYDIVEEIVETSDLPLEATAPESPEDVETAFDDGLAQEEVEDHLLSDETVEVLQEVADASQSLSPDETDTAILESQEDRADLPVEPPMETQTAEGGMETDEARDIWPSTEEEILEVIEDIFESESIADRAQAAASDTAEDLAAVEAAQDLASEAWITDGEAEEVASDIVEADVLEDTPAESDLPEEIADSISPDETDELFEEAFVETVEATGDETILPDLPETVSEEEFLTEPKADADAEGDIPEAISDDEVVVSPGEETEPSRDIRVIPSEKPLDEELREKTELLSRLAEAAGILEKLGPDLSGSVYTEDELRSKAKLLSEEFDRYLSIRDKYYNAHILIKGGNFLVGGAHLAKSELPEQIASLPDFYIGKFPVTNALFEIFVEQTGYITTAEKFGYGLVYYPRMQRSRDPVTGIERFSLHSQAYYKRVMGACWYRPNGPGSSLHLKRTHPVVQVSLDDARAFAAWTGKRLPTEIEWEAAARTPRGHLYPWGDTWQDDACNIEKSLHGDTTPVDQYIKFANPYEIADMLGNVLEWTCDVIGDRETSDMYIVKGASWISHGEISLTDRHYIEKTTSSNILGFRCVAI